MKVATSTLESQVQQRRETLKRTFHYDRLVRTTSSPLNRVIDQVQRVAPFDISVLVTGESGSGKELIARALRITSYNVCYTKLLRFLAPMKRGTSSPSTRCRVPGGRP